jgi:hypothetical protein
MTVLRFAHNSIEYFCFVCLSLPAHPNESCGMSNRDMTVQWFSTNILWFSRPPLCHAPVHPGHPVFCFFQITRINRVMAVLRFAHNSIEFFPFLGSSCSGSSGASRFLFFPDHPPTRINRVACQV